MSGNNPRFTSDRRPLDRASWAESDDWEAGVAENLDIDSGDLVARSVDGLIGEPPAMPVDNFETGGLSSYDTSSGGGFSVTSNQAVNGSYSLEAEYRYDSGEHQIFSVSGLDAYPQKGDTFSFWYRANGGYGDKPRVSFNYIDDSNRYMILINQTNGGPRYNEVRIFRQGPRDSVVCSTGGNGSWNGDADTWYEFEVVWKKSDEFELYIKDQAGNVEATGIGTDNDPLPAADGIAFAASGDDKYGLNTTKVWFDNFQIKSRP